MAAIVFAVTVLFTYAVGVIALDRAGKVTAERALAQHLDEISSSLDEAETAQRGYLLTANNRYLQSYRRALTRVGAGEGGLRADAAAGALPQNAMDSLLAHINDKEAELASTLDLQQKKGMGPTLAAIRTGHGDALTDTVRAEIDHQKSAVSDDLTKSMRHAHAANIARAAAFAFTVVANLAFLGWADRRLSRTARAREDAMLETTRQKELLGTTLTCIGDGVIVTDVHERVTFLNAEAVRLTGWQPDDAVGQPISNVFQIVNASTRRPVDNPVHKALQTGVSTVLTNHTLLLSKTGNEYPIDEKAAPIQPPNGQPFGVVLVFRDWTNQRRAQVTRARLAAIIESSEDAIISTGLDGAIQTWNIGAERLFGYTAAEARGKSIKLILPPDRVPEEEFCIGRIREGRTVRMETVRLAKDGRAIPVVLSVSAVKDETGSIIAASKILHDATETVAAREALSRSKAELERLVEERTAKLQEMVTELQHVSYSITHDMRAPLRAMSAFAEILMDQTSAARPTPDETADYCRRIVRAARRLDQLIVGALSYTKAVLQEMPEEPVQLDKVVRDLIDVYPHLQKDRADIEVDGTLPVVMGNESYLTQCFSNLLGNAVKFVAPGVRPRIRVRAQIKGRKARIWVDDNGIGISPAAQKRLFAMYEKLNDRYEGTGIGLAVVRKVVERMGGAVGVESEPGRGSHFWVELRLADRVSTPFQEQASCPTLAASDRT